MLESLQTAADSLFRPRASTPAVNRHIAAYEDARKQARDAALAGEKFVQVEEALDTLARTIETERATLVGLDADLRKIERIQRNLPRAARRAQLLEQLRPSTASPICRPMPASTDWGSRRNSSN